jgi:hypothetical protein
MNLFGVAPEKAQIWASPAGDWIRPSVGRGEKPSLGCLADLEAKGGSGASAKSRIGFGAVGDVAQLDFKSRHPWRGRKARSRHADLHVADDGKRLGVGDGAQPFQLEPRITLQKLP